MIALGLFLASKTSYCCSDLFFTSASSSQASVKLALSAQSTDCSTDFDTPEELEIWAKPRQAITLCGYSAVESGASVLMSTLHSTTYQLEGKQAQFYYYSAPPTLCPDSFAYQQQMAGSDQPFLLKRKKKQKSSQGIPFSRNNQAGIYPNSNVYPGLDDRFKPGKPFFPAMFPESLAIDIFPAFLKAFSLSTMKIPPPQAQQLFSCSGVSCIFRSWLSGQATMPDDYHNLILVVHNLNAEPSSFRISRQQLLYFYGEYRRTGHWFSLFEWVKSHFASRSFFLNHLSDVLTLLQETDDLWQTDPEVFGAITSQLQGVLEHPDYTFQLELELDWLHFQLAQIEAPSGKNKDNTAPATSQASGTDSQTQAGLTTSIPVASYPTDSGNTGGGEAPPEIIHSYNHLPCVACNHNQCKLKKPDKKATPGASPESASVSATPCNTEQQKKETNPALVNWYSLVNTYAHTGLIIRTTEDPASSVDSMQSGLDSSGTYLFPGSRIAPFKNGGFGVILSPDTPLVARFKNNAATIRVRFGFPLQQLASTSHSIGSLNAQHQSAIIAALNPLLGLIVHQRNIYQSTRFPGNTLPPLSLPPSHNIFHTFPPGSIFSSTPPNSHISPEDYNFLPVQARDTDSVHKNHINNFSLFLKLTEQSLITETHSGSTSGHITEEGKFKPGKSRFPSFDHRKVIAHNEVVICWDNWQNHLLGFFVSSNDYNESGFRSLINGIFSLNPKAHDLPVVFYDHTKPEIIYINSAKNFLSNYPAVSITDLNLDLLNPAFFVTNINYMAALLNNCLYPLKETGSLLPVMQNNVHLIPVLRYSCHRQLLENAGMEFTEEEAILLAFLSTISNPEVISDQFIQNLFQLLINTNVPLSVVNDLTMAVAKLANKDNSKLTTFFNTAPSPRWELYFYLINLGRNTPIYPPEILKQKITSEALSKLLSLQQEFNALINRLISLPVVKSQKGHAWPLLLNELRLVAFSTVVNLLRRHNHDIQPWPFAEIMACTPGSLSLLDQLEALAEDKSPFVSWLFHHFNQHGLPRHPGTLQSGVMTTSTRKTLEEELAKHPTPQQIDAIQSNYQTTSRSWENSDLCVWRQNPLEGMEQLLDWQPPMVGLSGQIQYIPSPSTSESEPVTSAVHSVAKNWKWPICLYDDKDDNNIKALICSHELHYQCLQILLNSHSAKKICPVCRKPLVQTITGNQPAGVMTWKVITFPCRGENAKETIEILYEIPAGSINSPEGIIAYPSDKRVAYLPNHKKGRKAFHMLKTAFERGLVLTVGYSQSRGVNNIVTWSDIPHKTLLTGAAEDHAYPDPGYLDRLISILKENLIEEPGDDKP